MTPQRSIVGSGLTYSGRVRGLEAHPHASAVLEAALQEPSHAYLFAGPAGSGKRAAASAFAAELLGADPDRVARGSHPDLTWVTPSGAHEMRREDVGDTVVAAAAHTPFESARRVFVLEQADCMTDAAANTLLKTLEEPPSYVVMILISDNPTQVLATIASRCQPVRFDPLSPEALAEQLGVPLACARLALGDGERAAFLATEAGSALRAAAEAFARGPASARPWLTLIAAGRERAAVAEAELEARMKEELEFLPAKERRRHEASYADRIRRARRRAETGTLDHALQLAGLYFRDLACVAAGAPELVHNLDRELPAPPASPAALLEAVDLVEDTRARLALNVTEELALEALSYRLDRTLGGP